MNKKEIQKLSQIVQLKYQELDKLTEFINAKKKEKEQSEKENRIFSENLQNLQKQLQDLIDSQEDKVEQI